MYLVKRVDLVRNPHTLVQIKEMVEQRREEVRVRNEARRAETERKAQQKAARAQEKAARKAREQLNLLLETVKPEERAELVARLQTGS